MDPLATVVEPVYKARMPATDTLSPDQAAALFDLPRPAAECRIVVAMSGGVDSSVVAALAARTGAEVIGITLESSQSIPVQPKRCLASLL